MAAAARGVVNRVSNPTSELQQGSMTQSGRFSAAAPLLHSNESVPISYRVQLVRYSVYSLFRVCVCVLV